MATAICNASVEESLKKLRVDQIDLLLLHWPNPAIPLADSIRALNEVKRRGLVKHIGLSNFTIALLDEAWRLTSEPLAAQQLEYHPISMHGKSWQQSARAAWCQSPYARSRSGA